MRRSRRAAIPWSRSVASVDATSAWPGALFPNLRLGPHATSHRVSHRLTRLALALTVRGGGGASRPGGWRTRSSRPRATLACVGAGRAQPVKAATMRAAWRGPVPQQPPTMLKDGHVARSAAKVVSCAAWYAAASSTPMRTVGT